MKKILIILAALIILSTVLIIYNDEKSKINIKSEGTTEETTNKQNPDNSGDKTTDSAKTENTETESQAQDQTAQNQEDNSDEEEREYTEPSCNLVRPGNLQYVECFAGYITTEKISLTISNDLGETINAKLKLNNCDTEKQGTIENNQEKEFIFYCQSENYFEEDIYITYEIQEKQIEVFGVVLGSVSD